MCLQYAPNGDRKLKEPNWKGISNAERCNNILSGFDRFDQTLSRHFALNKTIPRLKKLLLTSLKG